MIHVGICDCGRVGRLVNNRKFGRQYICARCLRQPSTATDIPERIGFAEKPENANEDPARYLRWWRHHRAEKGKAL